MPRFAPVGDPGRIIERIRTLKFELRVEPSGLPRGPDGRSDWDRYDAMRAELQKAIKMDLASILPLHT